MTFDRSIPAAGTWSGVDAQKTRPLRHLMRNFPYEGELAKYYSKIQADIGTGSLYNCLPMPWDHCEPDQSPSREWERSSRLYMTFDNPDDVASRGHGIPMSDPIPKWMPIAQQRFITTSQGPGEGYSQSDKRWNTTNARRMAAWVRFLGVRLTFKCARLFSSHHLPSLLFGFFSPLLEQLRSSSGYIHYLQDNPREKLLVGRDDDLAPRLFKKACQEGGLEYDEIIELHCAFGVLALRRNSLD
jgi:hypothetical protein